MENFVEFMTCLYKDNKEGKRRSTSTTIVERTILGYTKDEL